MCPPSPGISSIACGILLNVSRFPLIVTAAVPPAKCTSISSPASTLRYHIFRTGSLRFMAFLKKMWATGLARTALTPDILMTSGACSRLEPILVANAPSPPAVAVWKSEPMIRSPGLANASATSLWHIPLLPSKSKQGFPGQSDAGLDGHSTILGWG